jgi:hypothetical protein
MKPQWKIYVPPASAINNSAFCNYAFHTIFTVNSDYFLKNVDTLKFVIIKRGVFFAARTEFLPINWSSFGFKRLKEVVI